MEEQTVIATDPGLAPGADATRVISPPAGGFAFGDQTQQAVVVTCPVCSTANPPMERYCQDCGFLFGSAPGDVEPLPDIAELPHLLDAATGRRFPLNPGQNTVGREATDILLPDPTVSRRHAVINLQEGAVTVIDEASTNGSFVSGSRLAPGQPAAAYAGDVLRFGTVQLTLAVPGQEGRPPALPAGEPAVVERGAPVARLVDAVGREWPLFAGVNTIGRRSSNQIVLADAFASGKHAEVRCEPDGTATLIDLGSTNGTFVGGERLAHQVPTPLADGVEIRFGKSAMIFSSTRGTPAEAEPGPDAGDPAGPAEMDA